MKKTKIAIGIVDNHQMLHKAFAFSLMNVVRHFDGWAFDRRTEEHAYELALIVSENGGIAEMRNAVVAAALENDFDYIFWMDTDQTFPENCLPRLLSYCERDGREAASGLYTYKIPPYLPHVYPKLDEKTGKFILPRGFPLEQPIKIEGAGFGCLLMKTSIFKRMKKPYFTMRFDDGKMVEGEDLPFCREAKMDMVLDPVVSCGHLRTKAFNITDFLNYNGIDVVDGWIKPTKEQMSKVTDMQAKLMN